MLCRAKIARNLGTHFFTHAGVISLGHRFGINGPRRKAEQQPIGAEAVASPPQEQTSPSQGHRETRRSSTIVY